MKEQNKLPEESTQRLFVMDRPLMADHIGNLFRVLDYATDLQLRSAAEGMDQTTFKGLDIVVNELNQMLHQALAASESGLGHSNVNADGVIKMQSSKIDLGLVSRLVDAASMYCEWACPNVQSLQCSSVMKNHMVRLRSLASRISEVH